MLHWQETGPARPIAEIGPVRIDAVPAQRTAYGSTVDGTFLQIVDGRDGLTIGDLRQALKSALLSESYLAEDRFHIRFGIGQNEYVLIVDPAGERCRLAGRDWRGLSDMQALIDDALDEMRAMVERHRVFSPDGRIRIDYFEYERRNNEWLASPEIRDLATDSLVLKHNNEISDAGHNWLGSGRFSLAIDKNIYLLPFTLTFDLDAGTVRVDDGPEHPVGQAKRLIDGWSKKPKREPGDQSAPRNTFLENYNWRFALLCGAIAALFYLALFYFGGLI